MNDIDPETLRIVELSTAKKGYDRREVEALLHAVADAWEADRSATGKAAQVAFDEDAWSERMRHHRAIGGEIAAMVIEAQLHAESIIERAHRDAARVREEAAALLRDDAAARPES